MNWKQLTEIAELDTINSESHNKPILIFKHSTRCGISRFALKNFEAAFDIDTALLDIFYLDLLQYRPISTEISVKFNVFHQSPQAIVISKGEVIYHDSHSGINIEDIKKAIG